MGKRLIDDDLPQSRASDYRHNGHCPHYTRRFIECSEQSDGRGRTKYQCQDCGKTKEMKI